MFLKKLWGNIVKNKMPKKKLSTPAWITEGFDSPADYAKAKGIKKEKKGKTFKIKLCPACASKNVSVVLGEKYMWKCNDCSFRGTEIIEKDVSEEEFMKYLDEKGEEVA